MFKKVNIPSPFYSSIFGGLIVWLIIFILTPATVVNKLSIETILFVILSYSSLILGYEFVSKFFRIKNKVKKLVSIQTIYFISFVIALSFILRFIDIFYLRKLAFSNTIAINRVMAKNGPNSILFIIASVLKSLYFVPLALVFFNNIISKKLLILTSVIFLLPIFEAILRGSRSPFVQISTIFLIILFLTKKIKKNYKTGFLLIINVLFLFFISINILLNRTNNSNENIYLRMVEKPIYNDFFKPKNKIIKYMSNPLIKSNNKKILLSTLQFGQYYTHGLFEFDYIIKYYQNKKLLKQYGKYTFEVVPKFTNQFKLTNYNLDKIYLSSPRGYTFISLLGGFYIDFGWFSLIIFFIFGIIQRIIFIRVKVNFIYIPIYIYLLYSNFFMLTFNVFKGAGTYTLISCIIFAVIISLQDSIKHNY